MNGTKVIELKELNQEHVGDLLTFFETMETTERMRRKGDPVDCIVNNVLQYDMRRPALTGPLDKLAQEAGVDRKVILEVVVHHFVNSPSLVTS